MGESRRKVKLIGVDMSGLIGAKSCISCEFRLRTKEQPTILMCRRYPPQVVTMPIPDPRANGAWGVNGFYPQVNPAWPCGEYRRSEAFALEEIADAAKMATQQ